MDRISRFTGGYNTVTLFGPQIPVSEDEFNNSTGSTSFDSISRFEESMHACKKDLFILLECEVSFLVTNEDP